METEKGYPLEPDRTAAVDPEDALSILSPMERLSLRLRRMYERGGFTHYRMSRFEEYGLYQENQRFLSGEQVITFTDLDGRLLALKPDVTLSIAKNAGNGSGNGGRFYYLENVYRPGRENRGFEEISQMGLECIGAHADEDAGRVVELAARTLAQTGRVWSLETGHMGFVTGLFDAYGIGETIRPRLLAHIRDRNAHELAEVCAAEGLQGSDALQAMCTLSGPWDETLSRAETLVCGERMAQAVRELRELYGMISAGEQSDAMGHATEQSDAMGHATGQSDAGEQSDAGTWSLNLSLVNDMEYYNGLVLRGFVEGLPRPVLLGGEYDPLAARFHPGMKAIGFALYLNELERALDSASNVSGTGPAFRPEKHVISIALPKGRLGDKVYNLLAGVGYGAPEDYTASRKLVVENPERGIRYFLVKPSDVCVYVEHGAADIGIAGKDILAEHGADVYELLDTGLGRCRMCTAGPENFMDNPDRALRVATKFVNITKRYYAAQGRDIDIIKLNGSIELAPLLGLSDVIVDIVETGTTLKENHLRVLTEFMPISARLIANRSSYQFRRREIDALVEKLREAVRG